MSNDISADVKKYINSGSIPKNQIRQEKPVSSTPNEIDSSKMENAMNYLGAMGSAQVNMNNRVKKSVDDFLHDPVAVQAHVEMCDDLVKQGYPLEKAINTTDKIIGILSDENTYT